MLEPSWIGRRVTVRRVIDRAPDGRLHQADVVGDLLGLDAQTAVVESRSGPVEVPLALVTAARLALPSTADELALEEVVARGWQATDTGSVGGWLLRASGGFTLRGNSVLPLRPPGRPLEEALEAVAAWYAERNLPVIFQLPYEARRLLDAELGERGWPVGRLGEVHVMTARLDTLDATPALEVTVSPELDDAWLALYRGGSAVTDEARGLLARHDRVAFATLRDADGDPDGEVVAIGRGTVDDGWLGVTAVEVAPGARRRGHATRIMRALWQWGREQGAARTHLEVEADNAAAVALYERLGYHVHHGYHYRHAPEPAA